MFEQLAEKITIGSILLIGAELIALLTVAKIVMSSRSAAGVWGWAMSVIAFPFVAVPLYWILGRQEFNGYVDRRREVLQHSDDVLNTLMKTLDPHVAKLTPSQEHYGTVLDLLSERRFTKGNEVTLLKEGNEAFDEMFSIIEHAKQYVLVQFFIIKADDLGERLRLALEKKAREGVRVYLLYDEIGSYLISKNWLHSLRRYGAQVRAFHSTQGKSNRFQINFRNHRKMVIADGLIATSGGHNCANEYIGMSERFGNWRDTSVCIRGPAAMSLQMVFLEDWYWAAREIPKLNWTQPETLSDELCRARSSNCDMTTMVLPFGPVEDIEGGTLFFLNVINQAKRRLWIASPYFVPDVSVVSALQLAGMRGVDVRVMMPAFPDKKIPWLASFSFLKEMEDAGVKLYRYGDGFLHQKVILVDDDLASVGTANLDNRSMRLNFEVNIVVLDREFCGFVEEMLEEDFEECNEARFEDYQNRPWWFRCGVKMARLAAPVL